jgi:hypothetical protein
MSFTTKFISTLSLSLIVFTASVGSISTFAASSTPSASSSYNVDVSACRFSFDWTTYILDPKAGRRTSNPYTDQGCVNDYSVYQNGVQRVKKYKDFSAGTPQSKINFGEDEVMGIASQNLDLYKFEVTDTSATKISSKESVDFTRPESLVKIFNADELTSIFKSNPNGPKNYIPRFFRTGVDEFRTVNNEEIYYGGPCYLEAGVIKVRTSYAGRGLNSVDFGYPIDQNDAEKSCARRDFAKTTVEDMPLRTYQFIYERLYPNTDQCKELSLIFNYGAEGCLKFYQRTLGGKMNGRVDGNRFLAVYTYKGTFDDGGRPFVDEKGKVNIFNWVKWKVPELSGPRKQAKVKADNSLVQDNDPKCTNASKVFDTTKCDYLTNGVVRGYDGFSTFVL